MSNMFVGLGIALLLIIFHSGKHLKGLEDKGIDWVMGMYRGVAHSDNIVPYAFIDIDEASYRAWGEPWVTPRDKLSGLIQYAAEADAAVVIVDIDLSRSFEPLSDAVLTNYLGASSVDSVHPTPVIFAKSFRTNFDDLSPNIEVRPSFIDDIIDRQSHFYWASTLFDLEHDQVIRRWRMWEVLCEGDTSTHIPSIQLQALPFILKLQSKDNLLQEKLTAHAKGVCNGDSSASNSYVEIAGQLFHAVPNSLHKRIIYSIPWKLSPGESRPGIELDGKKVPILSIRSAHHITDSEGGVDNSWLKGKVVVIGASYQDSRDLFATPIGMMPGAIVLVNAIDSLIRYGEIEPLPAWGKLLIEAFLILIMSIAFARLHSFWGTIISTAVILAALVPISFIIFRSGVWLDFIIPLIAVAMHQLAIHYEDAIAAGKQGHH